MQENKIIIVTAYIFSSLKAFPGRLLPLLRPGIIFIKFFIARIPHWTRNILPTSGISCLRTRCPTNRSLRIKGPEGRPPSLNRRLL